MIFMHIFFAIKQTFNFKSLIALFMISIIQFFISLYQPNLKAFYLFHPFLWYTILFIIDTSAMQTTFAQSLLSIPARFYCNVLLFKITNLHFIQHLTLIDFSVVYMIKSRDKKNLLSVKFKLIVIISFYLFIKTIQQTHYFSPTTY